LFRLKIASSGRGALAGTRCAHRNYKNKGTKDSVGIKGPREGHHNDGELRSTKAHREDGDLPISQSPRGEASGAVAPATTIKTPSRLPVPRGVGSQVAMGGTEHSWSPSRGPGRPSSHRDEAVTSGAAQLLGRGTTR
jgi:hypothetical protein